MLRLPFIRNQKGGTAIEYAFILPVMLWMFSGTLEFSLYYYCNTILEGAVNLSSRLGKTGYDEEASTGQTREDMIIALLREESFTLMDPDLVEIETQVYESMTQIDEPEPFVDANGNGVYNAGETYSDTNGNGAWDSDMGAAGLGNSGDIVVYTAVYPWQIKTPFLSEFLSPTGDGNLPIRVSIVVKNEPWEHIVYGS
jgi:hypothetical protein